jgi:hypothetical protein
VEVKVALDTNRLTDLLQRDAARADRLGLCDATKPSTVCAGMGLLAAREAHAGVSVKGMR